MRKAAVTIAVLGLLVASSGTALGDPQAMATLKPPPPPRPPSVKIVGFSRPAPAAGAQPAPYTGGSLDVVVSVQNPTATPAEGILVKLAYGPSVVEKTISVAPSSTQQVTLTDPIGLVSSCEPRTYTVSLSGAAAITTPRQARVTPSCTFSSTAQDPWYLKNPDQVEYIQKSHAYFTNTKIASPPTCTKSVTFNGNIVNHTKGSSPSLIVQARAGDVVRNQTPAAFPLAAGEGKTVTASPTAGAPGEPAGQLDVSVVDWTKSLGTNLINQGITITTKRSCTLTYALDPETRSAN